MKIYQKLAVAAGGVAVFASVVTAPAAAADFSVSGKFGSEVGSLVDNGSFDGSYSYSGPPVGIGSNETLSLGLDSFSVNFRNATGQIVETLKSTDPDSRGGFDGKIFPGDANLTITGASGDFLQLSFPSGTAGFAGKGTVVPNELSNLAQVQGSYADVVSGRSEAVPEPQQIVDTVVAGCFFWLMRRKIASQKAKD